MNSFTVALITGVMCYLASGIGLFLVIYLVINPSARIVKTEMILNEKKDS